TEELFVGLAEEVAGGTKLSWNGAELDLAPPWKRLSVRDAVLGQPGMNQAVFDDPLAAAEAAIGAGVAPGEVARALAEGVDAAAIAELGGMEKIVAGFAKADERPVLARALVERYEDDVSARV